MLKHMNGPHGLHLGLEGTIRAVSSWFYTNTSFHYGSVESAFLCNCT
jgi:hypothetical protein